MDFIDRLKVFTRAAEMQSFTKAASALKMTKPSVSRYILSLEEELGVSLFIRTTRQIELTDTGRYFYEKAQDILSEINDAKRFAQTLNSAQAGNFALLVNCAFAKRLLLPNLPEFLRKNPRISLSIHTHAHLDHPPNPDLDAQILFDRATLTSGYVQKIASNRKVLCATPEYVEKFSAPRHPGELASHNCMRLSETESERWQFTSHRSSVCEEMEISGNFRSNDPLIVLEMTLESTGISKLPVWLVYNFIRSGELIELLPEYNVTEKDAGVFLHSKVKTSNSPKTHIVASMLAGAIGSPPHWA